MQTRGREIDEILSLLQHFVSDSDGTPLVVAGDFNSPSHLDWEHNTASLHRGLVVPWPVSRAMAKAGFVDAFRSIHTDVVDEPGYTWSPRFSQAWKDRIDYVYLHGSALEPRAAKVRGYQEPQWPSDHAAVVVDISID
jgi:endonuclease/exonuclease/phosphatase family metal-dependent hydrolase